MFFFKKIIPQDNKRKCRLLYLMGMTWHTKCMFDLDCDEPSFCNLLHGHGIETYAFDNSKNDHLDNVNTAIQLIKQHKIDYILAYSYGCRVVMDLLHKVDVKGIMLLDPSSVVRIKKEKTSMGSVVHKLDIDSMLSDNSVQITAEMRAAHIAAVSNTDTLTVPSYLDELLLTDPSPYERHLSVLFSRPCRLFLTAQSSESVRQWRPEATTLYPNSSHWIMIEPGRYQLALDVSKFINKYQ